ncbi:MAG: HAD-IIA family hydrolase [Ruminococcus sp.]|nr:HAD-IIA family hydrolase [Ruminococcus sp.]
MIMDYFWENADELKNKKLFLFDMDGTIYEEETLFDGTLQLLDYIKSIGGQYVFITNNSSKSVTDYIKKVNRLGIVADEDNFFTSSQATILYIKKNYPGVKAYCQGTKSFVKELLDGGIDTTEDVEEGVGLIVVGFDTELTSAKLRKTCELLNRDIPFIATNPDLACPVSFGFIPDCGSICMMLENATKRKPVYLGKPEATMINIVMEKFGMNQEDTVVVGDRLYTDIASGLNAGVTAICVLTGEATVEDIEESCYKPSYTFKNIKSVADALTE